MTKSRWGRHWFVIAAILLASGWVLSDRLRAWNALGQVQLAQQEIVRGQFQSATRRLMPLAAAPGSPGGPADYWLAVCEGLANEPGAALRRFGTLPVDYPFESTGAYLEAKANLTQGHLFAAETRLEQALARSGPDLDQIRGLLSQIYQIEVRFDDARALLYASLDQANDPTPVLRQITDFELDRLPYDGLRAALEKAGELAPLEERVWLGRARLGIEAGRWTEAQNGLDRCLKKRADAPVVRASIELARRSGRSGQALAVIKQHGASSLPVADQFELRAWLHAQSGNTAEEIATLERWLRLEPPAIPALERLAVLAAQSGQSDRVAELRRKKADAERALQSYRLLLWRNEPSWSAVERFQLARLAETAGRLAEARAAYKWALAADPSNVAIRDALSRLTQNNLAREHELGEQSGSWAITTASSAPAGPGAETASLAAITFTDDAETAGLRFVYDNAETPFHQLPEPFGGGLALFDYDGDGWLDVYCVQGGPFTPNVKIEAGSSESGDRLFHNQRNGHFNDVTTTSGISRFPAGHGHGVAVGDFDNDGHPDLFITRWRSYALYHNKGDGTFEDMTASSGLGGDRDWPTSAAFADFDNDGDLDLYVCHYAAWDMNNPELCRNPSNHAYQNCSPLGSPALPDHLFRNDSGRFVDVTKEAGIVDLDGRGLGVVAADFDGDRRIDLFVANDSSANFLFHNLGGMRFDEVGHAVGVSGNASGAYQAGMGVAAGDLDRDGRIDLAVTNFYGESTTFYRNLGEMNFTDATASIGLGVATRRLLGFGIGMFDANNDGRLDLASANGHVNDLRPNYPYEMPAQLLISSPEGRLTDVTESAGAPWSVPRIARGLAVGDVDNDGRIDLLILPHNQPLAYLHNRTTGGRFLTIQLEGRKSNRDAVGARVTVLAGGQRQVSQRVGGGSYQSASDPRIHFGIGNAARVESIEIEWPSGVSDRHNTLPADSAYLIRESQIKPAQLPGFPSLAP